MRFDFLFTYILCLLPILDLCRFPRTRCICHDHASRYERLSEDGHIELSSIPEDRDDADFVEYNFNPVDKDDTNEKEVSFGIAACRETLALHEIHLTRSFLGDVIVLQRRRQLPVGCRRTIAVCQRPVPSARVEESPREERHVEHYRALGGSGSR